MLKQKKKSEQMLRRIPRQIGVKVMFHWDGGGYGHDDDVDDDGGGDDIRGIKYRKFPQKSNSKQIACVIMVKMHAFASTE